MFSKGLDTTLKTHILEEKVASDFYNYAVLGKTGVKDTHDPKDMIPIE